MEAALASDPTLVLQLSADLPDAQLMRLARDMQADLSRAGLDTHAAEKPPAPGERGLLADVTKLVVDQVLGGAAGAVLDCLKAYFNREPSLKIAIRRQDG